MSHEVKEIERKQITNDQVSYRFMCCDDPLEDSWYTLSIHIEDHGTMIEAYKRDVAERHEKMVAWRSR